MDPKQTMTLDPKLRETYERVMKTNITPVAPQVQQSLPPTPQETTLQKPEPLRPVIPTKNVNAFIAEAGEEEKKKEEKASPVLIVLLAIVFFAGYLFFWVKFFNLKLPFLPS